LPDVQAAYDTLDAPLTLHAARTTPRGWLVVATVRVDSKTQLHQLLESSAGRLEIENVDINYREARHAKDQEGARVISLALRQVL
jgi:hypothetical protein